MRCGGGITGYRLQVSDWWLERAGARVWADVSRGTDWVTTGLGGRMAGQSPGLPQPAPPLTPIQSTDTQTARQLNNTVSQTNCIDSLRIFGLIASGDDNILTKLCFVISDSKWFNVCGRHWVIEESWAGPGPGWRCCWLEGCAAGVGRPGRRTGPHHCSLWVQGTAKQQSSRLCLPTRVRLIGHPAQSPASWLVTGQSRTGELSGGHQYRWLGGSTGLGVLFNSYPSCTSISLLHTENIFA